MPVDVGIASGGDASVGVPLMALYRWMLPPIVVFGSPVQRSKDESVSYWHIPISVRRRFRIGSGSLPKCSLFLDTYEGDRITDRIRMRWGDAVFSDTGETASLLTSDGPILAPVAWRQEGSDTQGYITDARHVIGRDMPYPMPADRNKMRFQLRVRVGRRDIPSPHLYIIRTPRAASNGHFTCEVEYEGAGSSGRATFSRPPMNPL